MMNLSPTEGVIIQITQLVSGRAEQRNWGLRLPLNCPLTYITVSLKEVEVLRVGMSPSGQ